MDRSILTLSPHEIRKIPRKAGVYLMRDASETVIYVGKAKDLRSRVRTYFSGGDERHSVQFLVARVKTLETIIAQDERQALVLEADLIRKYKPRYNIRLKDDKAYLMVRIDLNQDWPRIELVRAAKDDGARYLGPYAFGYELKTVLELIKKTIPLRTCSDHIMRNRVRPCIEYQIKRCLAPCCLTVDAEQYSSMLQQATQLLSGKTKETVKMLEHSMEKASIDLRFEDAADLRDKIALLQRFNKSGEKSAYPLESQDAFGFYRQENQAELVVVLVRQGKIIEVKTFGFSDVIPENSEFIEEALSQYYLSGADIPERILLPLKISDAKAREDIFQQKSSTKVKIQFPKNGPGLRLIEFAQNNARENFNLRFNQTENENNLMQIMAADLKLEEIPRVVECVDISHFQGRATVGSVVCFQDGFADKTRYRHFILSKECNDDFLSMREVLGRHLSRCAEENTLSDILIVDGGPPQLAQAIKVKKGLGLTKPLLISLAKKRATRAQYEHALDFDSDVKIVKPERIYFENIKQSVILKPGTKSLNFIEKIRNEAHRFAITFHRKRRSNAIFTTKLDNIPGVSAKRRNILLKEFGSVKALSQVAPEEINSRCKLTLPLAKRILFFLNKNIEKE